MSIEEIYQTLGKGFKVQTDTRKISEGEIYFALKGDNFNGNQFAADALQKGARYALVDEKVCDDERCLLVDNVLETLQALALYHRQQLHIPFLAITGSNGKTTTKELLNAVLSSTYTTYATRGNLNNHIGIPLTLLSIPDDAEIAIIEMGANHQKEIESYCRWVLPTHALINNCGKAHLEGFGGIEGVRKGKGELYDFMRAHQGTIFRNVDLDYLLPMASGITKQVTYGKGLADFSGIPLMKGPYLSVAITTPHNECTLTSQLVGDYNFANIMAAFAVGRSFGIDIQKIQKAIEFYSPDNSRSQLIHAGTNTIILDAYNANPSSMQVAIDNFRQTDYPNKVIMLGAMKELGDESLQEHKQIINLLQQANWNQVVLVGGDFEHISHPYLWFANAEEAAQWYQHQHFENTTFLIKGSRAYAMEKVISTFNNQ